MVLILDREVAQDEYLNYKIMEFTSSMSLCLTAQLRRSSACIGVFLTVNKNLLTWE